MRSLRYSKLFVCVTFLSLLGAFYIHVRWTRSSDSLYPPDLSVIYQSRNLVVSLVCEQYNLLNTSKVLSKTVAGQLYVEHSHKFIYCEVPKTGCSNWKRIILALNDSFGKSMNELKHYEVHKSPLLQKLSTYPPEEQQELLANYTKVMFTRHPMQRVVSAYRDKFLHDDDIYYSQTMAKRIRKSLGINVNDTEKITFQQFVHFIITEDQKYQDTHWRPMYQLCDPCNIQYDFIGRFETINWDSDFVLKFIGAPENLKYPSTKHHANDSRTNLDISRQYLEKLSPDLLRKLLDLYRLDFSMFEYERSSLAEAFQWL